MSHKYSRESGSLFPNKIMELTKCKDIDQTVAPIIQQIYTAQENNQFERASQLLDQNYTKLKPYIINSILINKLTEELYNTQIYAYTKLQQVFVSDTEPSLVLEKDDFWEQEY